MRLILVGAADSILTGRRRLSRQNHAAMAVLETIRGNCSLSDKQCQIVDHGHRVSRLSKKRKAASRGR
jgi:hypothetical protein